MLRDSLRKKQLESLTRGDGDTTNNNDGDDDSDLDGEWGLNNDKKKSKGGATPTKKGAASATTDAPKKTQQLRLSETTSSGENGKHSIVEVVEMNSTEVIEGIENVAVRIARQVLDKQVSKESNNIIMMFNIFYGSMHHVIIYYS